MDPKIFEVVKTRAGDGLVVGRSKIRSATGQLEERILVRFGTLPLADSAVGRFLDGIPRVYAFDPAEISEVGK